MFGTDVFDLIECRWSYCSTDWCSHNSWRVCRALFWIHRRLSSSSLYEIRTLDSGRSDGWSRICLETIAVVCRSLLLLYWNRISHGHSRTWRRKNLMSQQWQLNISHLRFIAHSHSRPWWAFPWRGGCIISKAAIAFCNIWWPDADTRWYQANQPTLPDHRVRCENTALSLSSPTWSNSHFPPPP